MEIIERIQSALEKNELQLALDLILECEKNRIESVELFNLKGVLALKIGEYEEAVEHFQRGKEADCYYEEIYYNLGYAYEQMGEYKKALNEYYNLLLITSDKVLKEEVEGIIDEISQNSLVIQENIIKDTLGKKQGKLSGEIYEIRDCISDLLQENETPLVSLVVLAYNKLNEYTKKCVEFVLKYTKNVNYELILVDNGSEDGTYEYFLSVIHPRKKVVRVTENKGAIYGGWCGTLECQGKYIIVLPNDVLVTKDWLLNMVKCAESDPRIGMVTPQSDMVSNLQRVDWEYTDIEDMQQKAALNNISDWTKWEERLRLITLGTMYKRSCLDVIGNSDYGFIHDFADDDITFRVRRAGYKAILCKDSFVSHIGKVTDKGTEMAAFSLKKGREDFKNKYYGIDAWDDCNNFEEQMLSLLDVNQLNATNLINILGVDVKCGTPILECKNKLRNNKITNVVLSAFSTEAKYWLDLNTICEGKVEVDRIEYIKEHFRVERFKYIILGRVLNEYARPEELLSNLMELLDEDGQLLFKIGNEKDINVFLGVLQILNPPTSNLRVLRLQDIQTQIELQGCKVSCITEENYVDVNGNIEKLVYKLLDSIGVSNKKEVMENLMVSNYIISVKKI